MLVAALLLALAAFVALVSYILTGSAFAVAAVFLCTGVGLVLFIADSLRKRREPSFGEGDRELRPAPAGKAGTRPEDLTKPV